VFLQQENSCWQIQIPSKISTERGDVLRVPLQVEVLMGEISQAGCWEVVGCFAGLCHAWAVGLCWLLALLSFSCASLQVCAPHCARWPPRRDQG